MRTVKIALGMIYPSCAFGLWLVRIAPMSKKHVIVVEDERDMADLIALRLKREGFLVDVAYDGQEAIGKIKSDSPDLVLLDLMMPKMSGTEVLREMRSDPRTSAIPVVVLTAKSEESDVVVGLQLGADDYVTKPFSMSVLIARISAVLRRAGATGAAGRGPMEVGAITIDTDRHMVQVSGQPVSLTRTEFRLLLALAAARGRVLTRNQLIDQTIGLDAVVTDRTIDVHLTALRRKLGDARECIKTVRGIGYRLALEDDETA